MFAIGEFSRITGLSVKTLRFYHEIGLLVPAVVDPSTGYRRYDARNVETARAIAALRALDFPLEEIGEILRSHGDEADLVGLLEQQKARLRDRIQREKGVLSTIDRIIENEKEARRLMKDATNQVEVKEIGPIVIAAIRMRGKYSECGKGFARLGKQVGRWIRGKPLCLYHECEYREDDADFETCFPVRPGARADGVDVRELPGGRFVSLLHRGPYEELGRSYEKALAYAKEQGHEISLPTREVYIKGPGMIFKGNPRKYLTEILLPIKS
jgi:DNA-binding transcriptional MerR regulator/effector-binding domain-containing protein